MIGGGSGGGGTGCPALQPGAAALNLYNRSPLGLLLRCKINLIASWQPVGFAPGLASGLGPQIGFLRTLRAHCTSPLAPSCSIPSAKMQATAIRSSVTRVALASEWDAGLGGQALCCPHRVLFAMPRD